MAHILGMFITLSALSIYSLVELWIDDKFNTISPSSSTEIAIVAAKAAISKEHNSSALAIILFAPFLSFWAPCPFLLDQFIILAEDPLVPPYIHRIYFCMVCAACAALYLLSCFLEVYMDNLLLSYMLYSFVSATLGMLVAMFQCLRHGRDRCFQLSVLLFVSSFFQVCTLSWVSMKNQYTILKNSGPVLLLFLRRLGSVLLLMPFVAAFISFFNTNLAVFGESPVSPVVSFFSASLVAFLSLFFHATSFRLTIVPLGLLYCAVVLHATYRGILRAEERVRHAVDAEKAVVGRQQMGAFRKRNVKANRKSYDSEDATPVSKRYIGDAGRFQYMELSEEDSA